jgi:hypothetical protein
VRGDWWSGGAKAGEVDLVERVDNLDRVVAVECGAGRVIAGWDDLWGETIFSNIVRVSGVLFSGVVFVSHEFYQAFLSKDANGSIRRWANIFCFGFGTGIGCWGGASGGAGFIGA